MVFDVKTISYVQILVGVLVILGGYLVISDYYRGQFEERFCSLIGNPFGDTTDFIGSINTNLVFGLTVSCDRDGGNIYGIFDRINVSNETKYLYVTEFLIDSVDKGQNLIYSHNTSLLILVIGGLFFILLGLANVARGSNEVRKSVKKK